MAKLPQLGRARLLHAGAVVLLACIWLVMLVYGGGPLDQRIYGALYVGGHPFLTGVARFFTAMGEPTALIGAALICALIMWYERRGRFGLVLLAVTMIGRILGNLQKYWIARPRPSLEPHLVLVKTSSFPSGHATSSMIFYVTLAIAIMSGSRWSRSTVAGAVLLSFLIGTSRVMLGVHWPSDVIGGWSFGALWVLLTVPTAERLFKADTRTSSKQL
jgi:undecaprenyl-diphosphatase